MRHRAIMVGSGAIGLLVLLMLAPQATLAGWQAAFVLGSAIPAGAVVLLLIARLTGADWGSALLPLASAMPWLLIGFVPVVVREAVFAPRAAHLALYLAWPLFALRGAAAILLWSWLGARLRRERLSVLGAGLALLVHGIVITFIATDWLLGVAAGQPNSAIGMALATLQIGAAAAAACSLGCGTDTVRRDLSYLLVAACLGLGYLMFMDYLIVWFGDLPSRVGWYVDRRALPWSIIPPLGILIGIAAPIGFAVLAASRAGARRLAGGSALVAFLLVSAWEVSVAGGWLALVAAAAGAILLAPLYRRETIR